MDKASALFASHAQKWSSTSAGSSFNRGHHAPVNTVRDAASLLLASLENDIQRLHEINSLTRKQAVKAAELLPRYRDYIAKLIAANRKPDAILVRNMIWAFDVPDLDYAMALATYIDKQGGATMPDGFRRDFYNYWYASIGDLAVEQMRNQLPITQHIGVVYADMMAHPERDIVDRIRAAVLSGQGGAIESTDALAAAQLYEKALVLDPKCGMFRRLKQLQKSSA